MYLVGAGLVDFHVGIKKEWLVGLALVCVPPLFHLTSQTKKNETPPIRTYHPTPTADISAATLLATDLHYHRKITATERLILTNAIIDKWALLASQL